MSGGIEMEQFTSEQAWADFGRHRLAMQQCIDTLGLRGTNENETPALVVGGSALAMYCIDYRIPGGKPSDLDVIVPPAMFRRLNEDGFIGPVFPIHKQSLQGYIKPRKNVPLSVDVITTHDPAELARYVGEERYIGEPNGSVSVLDGMHVLWPGVAAMQKVGYKDGTRVTDLEQVVKGHFVAAHRNHPVIKDDRWQDAVAKAIDRLAHNRVAYPRWRKIIGRGPRYSPWLQQLVEIDFDHPAFANINK